MLPYWSGELIALHERCNSRAGFTHYNGRIGITFDITLFNSSISLPSCLHASSGIGRMDSNTHLAAETIPALVSQIWGLFGDLEPRFRATSHATSVSSNFDRFVLWAGTMGVHEDTGNGLLEYRLRDSSALWNHVTSLLNDLIDTIKESKSRHLLY